MRWQTDAMVDEQKVAVTAINAGLTPRKLSEAYYGYQLRQLHEPYGVDEAIITMLTQRWPVK